MPITIRPYSANTFALSKVWFKCNSINLRLCDITTINSQVKSWLYQDCFEKPSEITLYRDNQDGGLGLHHVRLRAQALLIRSFMETAANPNFRHSLFHEILFRYHVQGEHTLPDPGLCPYYDKEFFATIRHYQESSPMNINVMTTKQWYSALLEDNVLKTETDENSPPSLIPVRVETISPDTDWKETWRLARRQGLPSDLTGFLFKLVHCLLPTQDRVSRLGGAEGPNPGICKLCDDDVETPLHAFFQCRSSMVAGLSLLGYVQHSVPDLSPEAALRLELGGQLDEEQELATITLLACGLKYIWDARVEKKQVQTFKMRAEAEARVTILRKTRYQESGNIIMEMLN